MIWSLVLKAPLILFIFVFYLYRLWIVINIFKVIESLTIATFYGMLNNIEKTV